MDFSVLLSATPESTGVSSVVVSQSVSQSVDFSVLLSATPESTGVSSIVVSQSVEF